MRKLITYFIICLVIYASCKKKEDKHDFSQTSISPEYLLPLGNFRFDIIDELEALSPVDSLPDSLLYNDSLYYTPTYLEDTKIVPISLVSISEEFDNIHLLMLRFIIYNGYPTSFSLSASLNDAGGNSIFATYIDSIPGAEVDTNNRVIDYKMSYYDIGIPETIYDQLNQVTQLTFYYRVLTQLNEEVITRFYDNYDIKVHVGARVKYYLNP